MKLVLIELYNATTMIKRAINSFPASTPSENGNHVQHWWQYYRYKVVKNNLVELQTVSVFKHLVGFRFKSAKFDFKSQKVSYLEKVITVECMMLDEESAMNSQQGLQQGFLASFFHFSQLLQEILHRILGVKRHKLLTLMRRNVHCNEHNATKLVFEKSKDNWPIDYP